MPNFYLRYFWRSHAGHTNREDQPLQSGTDTSSNNIINFCPHLRSDDRVFTSAVGGYRAAGFSKMMTSMVKCTSCKTELGVAQAGDDPYKNIQVTRNLGNMRSPVAAQWVAHLS